GSFFFGGSGLRMLSWVAWAVMSAFFSSAANRPAAQASRTREDSQRFIGRTSRHGDGVGGLSDRLGNLPACSVGSGEAFPGRGENRGKARRPSLRQRLRLALEQVQPVQRDGVRDALRAPQLAGRLAPVEADPARGVLLRAVDEVLQLLRRTRQRERLLD